MEKKENRGGKREGAGRKQIPLEEHAERISLNVMMRKEEIHEIKKRAEAAGVPYARFIRECCLGDWEYSKECVREKKVAFPKNIKIDTADLAKIADFFTTETGGSVEIDVNSIKKFFSKILKKTQ